MQAKVIAIVTNKTAPLSISHLGIPSVYWKSKCRRSICDRRYSCYEAGRQICLASNLHVLLKAIKVVKSNSM